MTFFGIRAKYIYIEDNDDLVFIYLDTYYIVILFTANACSLHVKVGLEVGVLATSPNK